MKFNIGSNTPFNLKVSDSKKTKDWYMNYMEYIVPFSESYVPNYDRMLRNYEIYNGDLTSIREETRKYCDPLSIYGDFNIEEELIAYPKLHNLCSILQGEKIKRIEDFKVMIMSSKSIKDKNEKFVAEIQKSVEERVMMKVAQMEAQMQGMHPSEVEKLVEEMRTQENPEDIAIKDFQSEWEIFLSKGLKYGKISQNTKAKELDTILDLILNSKAAVHNGWKNGKPCIDVRNILNLKGHKSPNEGRLHKGDWIAYIDVLTPAEVMDEYMEDLSDDDLESLQFGNYSIRDSRQSMKKARGISSLENDADLLVELGDSNRTRNKERGLAQVEMDTTKNLIYRVHFEFKAYKPVFFLKYTDEMGEAITMIVKDDFKIPSDAEKVKFTNDFGNKSSKFVWMKEGQEFQAERIWIPRKYEMTRLNNDVYVRHREVPFQVTDMEAPYSSFTLSTKSIVINSRNAETTSLFERALPLYFQLLYISNLQNREIAKYEGYVQNIDIDQIPESLGKNEMGEIINDPLKVALVYQRYLGKNFYSGSQLGTSGLPNPQRTPGSHGVMLSTANEIFLLQQLKEMIEREMSMAMGISPQRQAEFSSNTNVGDNQQAIAQSHHITEPLFFYHSQLWADVYKDYLRDFRTYAERILLKDDEEHSIEFFLEDGSKELMKITRKSVELVNSHVYVTNTANDLEYQNMMKQSAQAFSQNPEGMEAVSALVKSITSGSSAEETHKLIALETQKQQERASSQEQSSMQMQEKMAQMAKEDKEDTQAHEIELESMKNASAEKIAAMNNTARAEQKDADGDGVPDYMEILKLGQDADLKGRELDQKDRAMDLDKSKLESENSNKDADRKSAEKIASQKPAPSKG